jgi:hypothetical protein
VDRRLDQVLLQNADAATNDLPGSTICSNSQAGLQTVVLVRPFGDEVQIDLLPLLQRHRRSQLDRKLQVVRKGPARDCRPQVDLILSQEGHLATPKTTDILGVE